MIIYDNIIPKSLYEPIITIIIHIPIIPSGKRLQKAIENGPVEIVDLTMKNGGFFTSYANIYQRVISFISFEYNYHCSYMFIRG